MWSPILFELYGLFLGTMKHTNMAIAIFLDSSIECISNSLDGPVHINKWEKAWKMDFASKVDSRVLRLPLEDLVWPWGWGQHFHTVLEALLGSASALSSWNTHSGLALVPPLLTHWCSFLCRECTWCVPAALSNANQSMRGGDHGQFCLKLAWTKKLCLCTAVRKSKQWLSAWCRPCAVINTCTSSAA